MAYRPTIGLEVHAELKTHTKMFCSSRNDSNEERPNVNICPVCMAHPGSLPVINEQAVKHVLSVGVAVGGVLADYTEFDRKSYFYPDIPKGYQISQYQHPLVSNGALAGVALTRIHLEEDTARSTHEGEESLVDFNRAGVPLMELVTEPVIHDAETAGAFARELQLLLRTLGASDANLDKGEMRIEVNISIAPEGSSTFGTKVEVKNINSFRSVERAIAHEIERQTALLDSGGDVLQETRGWDEGKQVTFRQRTKEGSADYRYFPEPDLPKLVVSSVQALTAEVLRASLPELPKERRERYQKCGIKAEDARTIVNSDFSTSMFEEVTKVTSDPEILRLSANYLISDIASFSKDENKNGSMQHFSPEAFVSLIHMVATGKVSSRGAKDILAHMYKEGGDPETLASDLQLFQVSDIGAIESAVREVFEQNKEVLAEYKSGKEAVLGYLVGQVMKRMKGAGNPGVIREVVQKMSRSA